MSLLNGSRVIFVGKRPHHGQHADNVFIQEPSGDATRVLYARHGYLTVNQITEIAMRQQLRYRNDMFDTQCTINVRVRE
jgi:hypothetical protein